MYTHTYASSFSVAPVYMCLQFTTWDGIIYRGLSVEDSFSLSSAIDFFILL